MLQRHYNRNLISNPGEKAFDQALEDLRDDPDRTWHVCYDVRIGKHPKKKTIQHDFVLVTREGVITVEVKGGLVGMEGGQFQHLPDGIKNFSVEAFKESPIHQAHGAADALIGWAKEKEVLDTMITPVVAFPGCYFSESSGEYGIIWSRSVRDALGEFLLQVMKKARGFAPWAKDLSPAKQLELAKAFAPTMMPEKHVELMRTGTDLAQRRKEENERILDGLSDNMRIMVQGPPGSGKSPYAMRYMKQKADAGQKGLYLCWNELLAARVQQLIQESDLAEEVSVKGYYAFVQELMAAAGMDVDRLTFKIMDQLPTLLEEALQHSERPSWDYIVVDEGQDLFHRAVDRVLDRCLNGKEEGLSRGYYLVLYDLTYAEDVDLGASYTRFLQHAAHYRLADHFRGTGGDGLNALVDAINQGSFDLDTPFGADVKVVRYATQKDIPRLVYNQYLTLSGAQGKPLDAALLLHSSFLSDRENAPKELREALEADAHFERLLPENLAVAPTKLRYTTILKFKGLDRRMIFLVLPPEMKWDKKLNHQLLVGASRASVKLCILAPEKLPA